MGTIEIQLKEQNSTGTESVSIYNAVAALMEHDIGYLFILGDDGVETIQSMADISSIETDGIEIQHA